jgi:8-oxo-dGTP diphosphatase
LTPDTNGNVPSFPVVRWGARTVSFVPSPLPDDAHSVTNVVVFAVTDRRFLLADIPDRGWCVPSGRLEPGETPLAAAIRETREEVGAELGDVQEIGHYLLSDDTGERAYVSAFAGTVVQMGDLPVGTESCGVRLASMAELPGCYWMWDPLLEAVFRFALAQLVDSQSAHGRV